MRLPTRPRKTCVDATPRANGQAPAAPHSLRHGRVSLFRCAQRAPGVPRAGPAEEHGGPEKGVRPDQAVTPRGVSGPKHTVGARDHGLSSPSWKLHPWRALPLGNALPSLVPQISSWLGLRVAWKGPLRVGPRPANPRLTPVTSGDTPGLLVRPPPPPGGRSAHTRGHPPACPSSASPARRPAVPARTPRAQPGVQAAPAPVLAGDGCPWSGKGVLLIRRSSVSRGKDNKRNINA